MITPAQWSLFTTTVNAMLGAVLEETDADIGNVAPMIATELPSGSAQEGYGWTGMLPKPRAWNGPRIAVEPAAQTYFVVNRAWEGPTIAIDRFDLDDDKFGVYYRMLPDQARQVRRWASYSTRDLIEGLGQYASTSPGSPQNCTDQTPFFGTAHLSDYYNPSSITYCNDFIGGVSVAGGVPGGSGTNITVGGAFTPTAYATVYEYMLRLPGEDGEPLGVMPDLIMYPVTLKTEVELVLNSISFAPPAWATITGQVGAADNPFKRFSVKSQCMNPYLTSGNRWYLGDTKRAIKPLIWQVREAPVYSQRVNENDPVVFDSHRYLYGCWGRAAAAWGMPILMARSGAS